SGKRHRFCVHDRNFRCHFDPPSHMTMNHSVLVYVWEKNMFLKIERTGNMKPCPFSQRLNDVFFVDDLLFLLAADDGADDKNDKRDCESDDAIDGPCGSVRLFQK